MFISFPFLLSPLPYYAITFFPLNPPACSRDAGTSKRWRSCSLCIPSVLHLSFKNCFWKIPPSMCLQKKKSQHPCVSYKVQEVAVLTGVHGRGQDRTPCPHPAEGSHPFFFFFLKQVDSILPETKPKKAPGRGKSTHQVTHTTGQSPPDSSDRTPQQRNPQLKLNPPQVEQWQKGQAGEDGCCCAEKQQSNHGGQRKVNTHRYYSDGAQQEGFKVKPDKWKCLLKCIIVRNLENYQCLLRAVAPVLHYPFLVIY